MLKPNVYPSVRELFLDLVPEYKGRGWRPFCATIGWRPEIASFMHHLSARRYSSRIANYVIPGEFKRSKGSIRFGVAKEGHGYKGARGDFCLVGGSLDKGHLAVFYRRLELIGGLHYDLSVFNEVDKALGPIKRITIFAAEAKVFALSGNSNEKLYHRLKKYYARS